MSNNNQLELCAIKGRIIYYIYNLQNQPKEFQNFLKYIGLYYIINQLQNKK